LHSFNDKQQVKWFEEIHVLVQTLVARGMYHCVMKNFAGKRVMSLGHKESHMDLAGIEPTPAW
jgi:hypothetical protein